MKKEVFCIDCKYFKTRFGYMFGIEYLCQHPSNIKNIIEKNINYWLDGSFEEYEIFKKYPEKKNKNNKCKDYKEK